MKTAPLALVDINNCYASCERIFQPQLQHQPVLVVGSNDGNVVARSNEVKQLGIPMGAPLFQYEALIQQYHIAVRSANWALYGDVSARVMATLAQFTSELEVYSVDEAWLTLPALNPSELAAYAQDIRATVRQWVKLPASVGVAQTKTLAKAANKRAKKLASGVLVLQDEAEIDALLATMPAEDVWGIGPRRAEVLRAEQRIHMASDLKHAPERWVKQRLSVAAQRTVLELRGIPCIPLELAPPPKQQIACAQAFGQPVEDLASLREAVASYMVRAAERLRKQSSKAGHVTVYLQTNPFRLDHPQYARSLGCALPEPTSATGTLITAAQALLSRLYIPGYQYHRTGVFLQNLVPDQPTQLSLFTPPEQQAKQEAASRVADSINQRFGRGTITFASVGTDQPWRAKQANISPHFTTRLSDVPLVR